MHCWQILTVELGLLQNPSRLNVGNKDFRKIPGTNKEWTSLNGMATEFYVQLIVA